MTGDRKKSREQREAEKLRFQLEEEKTKSLEVKKNALRKPLQTSLCKAEGLF